MQRHPVEHGGRFRGAWSAWASASVICWGVWLATVLTGGGAAGLWPVWVTVPWGGVLLARELTERHSGDGSDGWFGAPAAGLGASRATRHGRRPLTRTQARVGVRRAIP